MSNFADLRSLIPSLDSADIALASIPGGRRAALLQLSKIEPALYGKTRNHLDGDVTRLSPYLRHGVLALAEVRDFALTHYKPSSISKFLNELAWRDYYQRVWHVAGDLIWKDLEPYKTGRLAADYADELPSALLDARTGIDYVDYFVNELQSTGYLHNHARMWLAAYVVHGLKCKWQAGARWFLRHLMDGDEASNNLSWQWCASTFSHKPYIYNRENVHKYSGDRFHVGPDPRDPFDGSYEDVAARLFDDHGSSGDTFDPPAINWRADANLPVDSAPTDIHHTVTWVHDGMLSATHPAIASGCPCFFAWDLAHIKSGAQTFKRLDFQNQCLEELPNLTIMPSEDVAKSVAEFARQQSATRIRTGHTPDPRLKRVIKNLRKHFEVLCLDHPPLVELEGAVDLKRFSRYWGKAEKVLIG